MAVSIFVDDGVTVKCAEKCIMNYNNLKYNPDILVKLEGYLTRFFLYMYDEWQAMGIYDDIVDEMESVM